jgi:hypothetical protein
MPIDMNALARAGATVRLTQLEHELAALRAAFPDLDGAPTGRKRGRPAKLVVSDLTLRPGKRSGWSEEARKAVGERMKAYWAKRRGESKTEIVQEAAPKKKGTMSAEGRARIAAAQRKRWAAAKAKKG